MLETGPVALKNPALLHIAGDDAVYCGADQEWFAQKWQRQAGCGPTACAHLLWYLARTRPQMAALCPQDIATKEGFTGFMQQIWDYVTPGRMGVNKTTILTEGGLRYAKDCGIQLQAHVLEVPAKIGGRPSAQEVSAFVCAALNKDLPVAFLNLSNGALGNLDSWHWVTLVSFAPGNLQARMYDQGKSDMLDIALWLRSSKMGGGFVALAPEEEM